MRRWWIKEKVRESTCEDQLVAAAAHGFAAELHLLLNLLLKRLPLVQDGEVDFDGPRRAIAPPSPLSAKCLANDCQLCPCRPLSQTRILSVEGDDGAGAIKVANHLNRGFLPRPLFSGRGRFR